MKKVTVLILVLIMVSTSSFSEAAATDFSLKSTPSFTLGNYIFNDIMKLHGFSNLYSLANISKEEEKETEKEKEEYASIVFTGDLGVGSPYGQRLRFHDFFEQYGPKYFFEKLKSITDNTDGYFVNLENPFTESTNATKKIWTYKAHSLDYLDILSKNNVKWATIMNNHIHDYGKQGHEDTMRLLEEKGIVPVGTNITKAYTSDNEIPSVQMERREIIEINGIKIGVVGYVSYYQNMIPTWKVKEDIEFLKANSDYVVLNMHWGNCYTQKISTLQRTRAREFAEFGPDLIIGNHPHVLQEIEKYKDTTIYYSLGNFIFAHKGSVGDINGVLVDLQLTKKGDEVTAELVNIPINWPGHSSTNKFQPYIETNETQIKNIERKLKTDINFNLEDYLERKDVK